MLDVRPSDNSSVSDLQIFNADLARAMQGRFSTLYMLVGFHRTQGCFNERVSKASRTPLYRRERMKHFL